MYSYFWQTMEAGHGDLGDIVCGGTPPPAAPHHMTAGDWQFPGLEQVSFPLSAAERLISCELDDAPSSFQNPLHHELAAGTAVFSDRPEPVGGLQVVDTAGGGSLTDRTIFFGGDIREEHHKNGPCDIFSRVLQISPGAIKPPQMITGGVPEPNGRSAGCSVDHAELPMPSTPGGKRRKSPAKKVVCIPAPAPAPAASSRPGGEVVPSDLWAWRKYGQKPIKGSPYPRGYYRCSSSKGCSARKQVERSRTDPSMLVVTYTSEHNHPWPTQRTNALAGSTRSSLPAAKLGASAGARRSSCGRRPAWSAAGEERGGRAGTAIVPPAVKEEAAAEGGNTVEPAGGGEADPDVVVGRSYETRVPPEDGFFAALDELGGDPLGLVELPGDQRRGEGRRGVTPGAADPFGILDWAGSWLGEAGNYGDL